MAYDDAWDDAVPAGSEQANHIDEHIRLVRSQIHQRMDDIVEDWLADPIVLKTPTIPGLPLMKTGLYTGSLPADSRGSGYAGVSKVLSILVTATADSSSTVTIDLDEFNNVNGENTANYYHVDNICGLFTKYAVPSFEYQLELWAISSVNNTIQFQAYTRHDVNIANGTVLQFYLQLLFNA